MPNCREPKPSEVLKEQLRDMQELYNQAKLNENAPLIEKLGKTVQNYLKQIRDHEVHERETLKRTEIRRKATLLGILIGQKIKKYVSNPDQAALLIEDICEAMQELIDVEEGDE